MTDKLLLQFRVAVYQSLLKRPDAVLDFIDALTVAGHVESPVTLSEQTPFWRKFSMVYDTLCHAVIDLDALLHALLDYQPGDSETIGGYKVYGLDATKDERPEAKTLPERCSLKSQKDEPVVYGHKYSWLVRLVGWGTSWVAPQDTFRIDPELSDSQVGSQQVKELYEQPELRQPGKKGAPKKHGARFKLSSPARPADGAETFLLGLQTVHIQAWNGLHLKKLSKLVVMLLRVEFLKPDGKPRYKQPMWLLWTGPSTVSLQELCKMYLWRFAIEHMFRFLKQNMGLNSSRSNDLVATEHWMWMCALAYWQLLLMRDLVEDARPAWHPRFRDGKRKQLTPGQVQRATLRFLLQLGTPAKAPKVAGNGKGRSKGYHPAPRKRYPVVKKAQTGLKQAIASP